MKFAIILTLLGAALAADYYNSQNGNYRRNNNWNGIMRGNQSGRRNLRRCPGPLGPGGKCKRRRFPKKYNRPSTSIQPQEPEVTNEMVFKSMDTDNSGQIDHQRPSSPRNLK